MIYGFFCSLFKPLLAGFYWIKYKWWWLAMRSGSYMENITYAVFLEREI
jgi:hypothetical protein